MQDSNTTAQTRFAIISLVRLAGTIMVAIGLLSVAQAMDWIPAGVNYAMVIIGFFMAFIAPRLLARRWRSPDMDQD
ncbi:hypothetical protein [Sphingorhabdus sp. Alg239-R122]|uniref:hypothetical protein n=1 Tax=Sphingorhabdus sp. Alg239-R122 TaxID=2305989 RepID=UPI0013DA77EA|nr:hypothetical protein [Sphingorhabdus sp. Alg239-R122]